MSQLAAAQAAFFNGIKPEASVDAQMQAAQWLDGTDAFAGIARLGVYRDMYVLRLTEALRIDYEQVARALGEAVFETLVRSYIVAYPPKTPSLNGVGAHFADHLQAQPGLRCDIADLAQLEWARVMAAHAPMRAPVTFSAWLALGPEQGTSVRFVLNPSLICIETAYLVCPVWQALEHQKTPLAEPIQAPSHTAIWRDGPMVAHRPLSALEAQALHMLGDGCNFAGLCALFVDDAQPAQAAAQLMAHLFASTFIARFKEL